MRTSKQNWCIFSKGPINTHIVLGISNKPEEMLNLETVKSLKIPVIRRYSGGGTVICDSNTYFVSFILNKSLFPPELCFPPTLTKYFGLFYQNVFNKLNNHQIPQFSLLENDYLLSKKKFGGNAQCIFILIYLSLFLNRFY